MSVQKVSAITEEETAPDSGEPYFVLPKKMRPVTENAADVEKHETGEKVKVELLEKVMVAGYLLWGSWHDVRKRSVPVRVLTTGAVLAFADIIVVGWENDRITAMLPGILLLLLSKVAGGIGEADGMIVALVGFMNRDNNILLILGVSLLYIFFYSMILFCRRQDRNLQIPYLPFLLVAYVTTWIIEG